ncbi:cathepsin F-like [Mobula birostris]|uniref:cathepsin F-like n=1 Tax=Mobula birostris TaxID=1983395 RepID=UPI003B285CFE
MHRRLVLLSLVALTSRCCGGRRCDPSAGLEKDKMMLMFQDFMKTYNKTYKDQEEELRRFEIFMQNMEEVRKLQEAEQGTARYGVTRFSDLSADEFTLGSSRALEDNRCEKVSLHKHVEHLPEAKDWRDDNVTPVKNQMKGNGKCKSCWAFSVVGNVESQWSIRKKQLISLSEQELLDCGSKGNNCKEGRIDVAFEDVKKIGLVKEDDYPYEGKVSTCHQRQKKTVVKIQNCIWLPENERAMQQYVAFNGTISVLVTLLPIQQYKGGIMKTCSEMNKTFHAMLIVGYGIEDSTPYWIVKNSWGKDWGEEGYIRIYRGAKVCGINKFAMSAVV